jgi:hypothetical protein
MQNVYENGCILSTQGDIEYRNQTMERSESTGLLVMYFTSTDESLSPIGKGYIFLSHCVKVDFVFPPSTLYLKFGIYSFLRLRD